MAADTEAVVVDDVGVDGVDGVAEGDVGVDGRVERPGPDHSLGVPGSDDSDSDVNDVLPWTVLWIGRTSGI